MFFALQACFLWAKVGKEDMLTFEHKAVQLWVSVIPPKYS